MIKRMLVALHASLRRPRVGEACQIGYTSTGLESQRVRRRLTPTPATHKPLPRLTARKLAALIQLIAVSANHLVVAYREITFDEEAVVLWIKDCLVNVVA